MSDTIDTAFGRMALIAEHRPNIRLVELRFGVTGVLLGKSTLTNIDGFRRDWPHHRVEFDAWLAGLEQDGPQ